MANATEEIYIIYLRKSRADNPHESVEEVLSKHEEMLQEHAERVLGRKIEEQWIFREIVSGETIEERPKMSEVLRLLEDPRIKGVFCIEPQRLSRGSLSDCGKIVDTFLYTKTEIVTLNMTYNLSNKMERKFFESELMRGNDYLEYTKEILMRGRINSVKRGCFIGNNPPFGYNKITKDGLHTLEPNEDAPIIKMIFEMYVNGSTALEIARHLDALGVKPTNSESWEKCSVRFILQNPHYAGYVRFGYKRTEKTFEDGQLVKHRSKPNDPEEVIVAKGLQEPIISEELFNQAQEKTKERGQNNPRNKWDAPLKNPLAGLMFCQKCGRAITQHPYKHARDRFECRNRTKCKSKSAPMDEVFNALIFALETEHLPELEVKLKNNEGNAAEIQKKQLAKMLKELDELQEQERNQYVFLEKGIYSEDTFLKRNKEVHEEMDALKSRIFNAKQTIPKEINYEDKIVKLHDAIKALRNDTISPKEKNQFLKAIIKRIEYEYIAHEGKGKTIYKLHIFLNV